MWENQWHDYECSCPGASSHFVTPLEGTITVGYLHNAKILIYGDSFIDSELVENAEDIKL